MSACENRPELRAMLDQPVRDLNGGRSKASILQNFGVA